MKEDFVRRYGVVALMVILAANVFAQTSTKTFYANDDKKRDVVTFTSKAPLETIVGTTGQIVGFVETDIQNVMNTKARFEVDLVSVKTGIDMRDGHMRDQYLETAKYPRAIFELTKVVSAEQSTLQNQKTVNVTVEGNFTVHGVSKPITIPLTITYYQESEQTQAKLPGDLIRISGTWNILLSDYKINRPQFVLLKLDDKQKVEIDVFGSTGSPVVTFAESNPSQ
jgi:polyisoprenoid-binding protein YceI